MPISHSTACTSASATAQWRFFECARDATGSAPNEIVVDLARSSGVAFAISEGVDWLMFTFTKYRLSTRILLSSLFAAPVDTTVFLYGADLAKQMEFGAEPGNSLHVWNWIVFVIGKMVGAVIVSVVIRRREDLGLTDPKEL